MFKFVRYKEFIKYKELSHKIIDDFYTIIENYQENIEKMKNCHNCKHYNVICGHRKGNCYTYNLEHWELKE